MNLLNPVLILVRISEGDKMDEILKLDRRGIDLSSGTYFEFDDGNLDPETTNRIVKNVIYNEDTS